MLMFSQALPRQLPQNIQVRSRTATRVLQLLLCQLTRKARSSRVHKLKVKHKIRDNEGVTITWSEMFFSNVQQVKSSRSKAVLGCPTALHHCSKRSERSEAGLLPSTYRCDTGVKQMQAKESAPTQQCSVKCFCVSDNEPPSPAEVVTPVL